MKAGIDYIGVSVGALILNDKGDLFLTKRGSKATNERGTWEIPGGKVDFGETLAGAVCREMKEEYGVDIELIYQFPAQNHLLPDEDQHWVPTCFLARIKNGITPVIKEPEKCEAVGWFSPDRMPTPLSVITKLDLVMYSRYLKGDDIFAVYTK